jgi:hypothetical protein
MTQKIKTILGYENIQNKNIINKNTFRNGTDKSMIEFY